MVGAREGTMFGRAWRKMSVPSSVEAPTQDRRPHGVAVALAIVLIAAILRLFCLQALGTELVFITFYPAVMIAAVYSGLRGGLAATLASAVISDYFWMTPTGSLILARPIDWVAMAIFVGSGILVSSVADQLLRTQARLRRGETWRAYELEQRVAERTASLLQATAILRAALAKIRRIRSMRKTLPVASSTPILPSFR
jgi:K+-sensing histidine kinase KdpD